MTVLAAMMNLRPMPEKTMSKRALKEITLTLQQQPRLGNLTDVFTNRK